jgi:hypothetical protein
MSEMVVRPRETPVPPWGMSAFAMEAYRKLGGLAYPDPENQYALAALVEAMSWLPGLLRDAAAPRPGTGETPWAAVVDPWRCPWWALRWCAQLYGIRLLPDLGAFVRPDMATDQAWRQAISDRIEWRRGHVSMLARAAQQYMIDQRRVQIRERYNPDLGDGVDAPKHIQVRVRASDVDPQWLVTDPGPPVTYTAPRLEAAVRAQKPITLILHLIVTNDRDWDDVVDLYPTWDAAVADNATWTDLVEAD